jgi:hypothetical protein
MTAFSAVTWGRCWFLTGLSVVSSHRFGAFFMVLRRVGVASFVGATGLVGVGWREPVEELPDVASA